MDAPLMVPEILVYEPKALARKIVAFLDQQVREKGKASLGLPGGRSPGELLQFVARFLGTETRNRLGIFWVDERWVPKGDKDRNDGPILGAWRDGGPVPGNVFPMPGAGDAADPSEAAVEYARTLESWKPGPLDLAIFGLGEDGHVASLFPHHPGLRESKSVFVCRDAPKPPDTRLSLSLPFLSQSQAIVVLVLGAQKGRALAAALENPGPQWPISRVWADSSTRVRCYLDSEAFDQLPQDPRS